MPDAGNRLTINAEPTKTFFVDMLTRDIALEQAVLDLVDNSVDGAKALANGDERPFEGMTVHIEFSEEFFRIIDNCGGFSAETAANYAFRFGRAPGARQTPHSIGQFGVGMKRALFKFGHHFSVRSSTAADSWAVEVDVPQWEVEPGWQFPWAIFREDDHISTESPGTEIIVKTLRKEVASRFSTKNFENSIIGLIKSKHRQFIAGGLTISVNGHALDATSLHLLLRDDVGFRPGTDELVFDEADNAKKVVVRIIVGIGPSFPKEAGWYVVCNGRVILEADRRAVTGWGAVEEQSQSLAIPSFHNQFARFRGIVYFDSNDSSRVPWNTTKTDVDQDNAIWQAAFARMMEMMRPAIKFLNELDSDIEEHTREESPLLQFISTARTVKPEELPQRAEFAAPARGTLTKKIRTIKIQYSKSIDQVNHLMEELSVSSAKAVGERTFDLIYKRMGGE